MSGGRGGGQDAERRPRSGRLPWNRAGYLTIENLPVADMPSPWALMK